LSVVRCDVAEHTEVLDWIAAIRREEGAIDILVNNAAFVNWKSVQEMSVEAAIRSMEVGYHGMVYTIKAVLPDMLEAGWGRIVNMGSSAGRIFVGSASAAYAGAKAAIGGYTQMLQLELRGAPVRVTLVRPGAVAGTNFFRKYVSSSQLPRLGDFLPYLVPSQVAHHVVRAIKRGTPIVDIPGYMPLFYFVFDVAPSLLRWVLRLGGPGRRDYGQVAWTYDPYLSSQEE
jgi:short-subunit dehydrogenase